MVDHVSNPNMHYKTTNVGILNPPDKLPKKTVYSYAEGQRMYNEMQNDIYDNYKKANPPKKKFPLVLKILGAITALGVLFATRKSILQFVKGLFGEKPKISTPS